MSSDFYPAQGQVFLWSPFGLWVYFLFIEGGNPLESQFYVGPEIFLLFPEPCAVFMGNLESIGCGRNPQGKSQLC